MTEDRTLELALAEAQARIRGLESRLAELERVIHDLGNAIRPRSIDPFQMRVEDYANEGSRC